MQKPPKCTKRLLFVSEYMGIVEAAIGARLLRKQTVIVVYFIATIIVNPSEAESVLCMIYAKDSVYTVFKFLYLHICLVIIITHNDLHSLYIYC